MERERTTAPKPLKLKPSQPPVGYRFHPNDAELAGHFLKKKLLDLDSENMPIAEVKVCDFEPWELPEKSKLKSNDRAWYFFCPRDFKYANSRRSNRKTKMGFWKPTGNLRNVKGIRTKEIIGTKRTLVFYQKAGKVKIKTNWIMHEYEYIPVQGNFVACKLKFKPDGKTNKVEIKERAPTSPTTCENEMTVTSSCDECDPNDNTEDHNVGEMADISTYKNDEHSCAAVCDIGDSYSDEVISCSGSNESQPGYHMISEYYSPNKMIAALTFRKNKFSSGETCIFKGQNSGKSIDIFCSEKGECSSPFAAFPDCRTGNKIPCFERTSLVAAELEVITEQPLIDVQGPSTFFDDMNVLIESNDISSNSPLATRNEDK